MASYLRGVPGHRAALAADVPELAGISDEEGQHPRRMMALHASLMERTPELELLYVIGFFDRPAAADAIQQFRKSPAILNLNEKLCAIDDGEWIRCVQKLRQLGLLAPATYFGSEEIDAHPLVREHFGAMLRERHPAAWYSGHSCLSDYHRSLHSGKTPENIREMQALILAAKHGCQAGRQKELLEEVYWPVISRKYESYLLTVLGAPQTDLSILSNFFISRWDEPIAPPDNVDFSDYPNLANLVGFRLLALGELEQSSRVFEAELEKHLDEGRLDWALISASNLSNIFYLNGDLASAIEMGRRNVALCEDIASPEKKHIVGMANVRLAASLYAIGKTDDALAILSDEELRRTPERKRMKSHIRLSTLATYHYTMVLLSSGDFSGAAFAVKDILTLHDNGDFGGLVDKCVDNLILGSLAQFEDEAVKSRKLLTESVDIAYDSGNLAWIAPSLIARSRLYRRIGDLGACLSDLVQGISIAQRGEMRLFECDAHLEYTRLALAEDNTDAALSHFKSAQTLVSDCGYHRRDGELSELKEKLGQ